VNLNLAEAMRQWTKLTGHPLVTITNINNTHISIKQQRFVLNSTTPYEALKE
jgi:aminopeptidase N